MGRKKGSGNKRLTKDKRYQILLETAPVAMMMVLKKLRTEELSESEKHEIISILERMQMVLEAERYYRNKADAHD